MSRTVPSAAATVSESYSAPCAPSDRAARDLMRLRDETEHPHWMPQREYDSLFGVNVPVIVAYHGYPCLIHFPT
ncbi:hypothetical protein BH93_19310 [Rhodococcoides fascians A25f]|uniref:phosphoketolase family protein n=1 Tax=Rhodococcoides fascians TaxID=1828 RepID=UPI0005633654|nr:hypothetical protein [Rhodococcus fascians]QII07230.1 hypothetical protein BH93_19310 [Rhodococcus fascians A25f]